MRDGRLPAILRVHEAHPVRPASRVNDISLSFLEFFADCCFAPACVLSLRVEIGAHFFYLGIQRLDTPLEVPYGRFL